MTLKKPNPVIIYLCGTTYNWELGTTEVATYPTVKAAKKANSCWTDCGIAMCEVKLKKWAIKPQGPKMLKKALAGAIKQIKEGKPFEQFDLKKNKKQPKL